MFYLTVGVMSLIGAYGNRDLLTPGVTMIPACACKLVACIDPYVYAISHPKYRYVICNLLFKVRVKVSDFVTILDWN